MLVWTFGRGLRLKAIVLSGQLEWSVDPATGHLVIGKKTQAALAKVLSKSPLGQVAMHWHSHQCSFLLINQLIFYTLLLMGPATKRK